MYYINVVIVVQLRTDVVPTPGLTGLISLNQANFTGLTKHSANCTDKYPPLHEEHQLSAGVCCADNPLWLQTSAKTSSLFALGIGGTDKHMVTCSEADRKQRLSRFITTSSFPHLFLFSFASSLLRVFRGLRGGFPLALLFLPLLLQFLHELRDEVRAVQVLLGLPCVVLAARIAINK